MDTFWIVLAIVIVGSLIAGAINKNSQIKIALAEQKRQDKLNSPECQAQATASLDYFKYLNDVLDWRVLIAEAEIKLFNPPKWIHIYEDHETGKSLDETYYITADKEIYNQNKQNKNENDIRLVSESEFLKIIKSKIHDSKKTLNGIETEYQEKYNEHSGNKPENLEIIREKYELDKPFPPDFDHNYFNEYDTSSWSMYEENRAKLRELEHTLTQLRDPKTRRQALSAMERRQKVKSGELDDELFQEAIRVVVESGKASASFLQRQLRIGYAQAARLLERMEEQNIIEPADGVKPRKVLVPKEDYKQKN